MTIILCFQSHYHNIQSMLVKAVDEILPSRKNRCDSSRKIFQVLTKFDQQNLFLVVFISLIWFCRFYHMCLKAICEPNQFSQLNNCLLGFKSHHELMSMEENSSNYEGNTTILQKFSNVHQTRFHGWAEAINLSVITYKGITESEREREGTQRKIHGNFCLFWLFATP